MRASLAQPVQQSSPPAPDLSHLSDGISCSGFGHHLGITSYTLKKLRELLDRYPADVAVKKVRVLIVAGIEEVLETGKSSGGNTIISWYPEERQYREFRQIT